MPMEGSLSPRHYLLQASLSHSEQELDNFQRETLVREAGGPRRTSLKLSELIGDLTLHYALVETTDHGCAKKRRSLLLRSEEKRQTLPNNVRKLKVIAELQHATLSASAQHFYLRCRPWLGRVLVSGGFKTTDVDFKSGKFPASDRLARYQFRHPLRRINSADLTPEINIELVEGLCTARLAMVPPKTVSPRRRGSYRILQRSATSWRGCTPEAAARASKNESQCQLATAKVCSALAQGGPTKANQADRSSEPKSGA
ncbi:hypothetical protein DFH09DRAFT_1071424 [Mycena vulgaris]|nr:hypothetical protein DFH09DRAFT_1071424 [Mycena vulgaris]